MDDLDPIRLSPFIGVAVFVLYFIAAGIVTVIHGRPLDTGTLCFICWHLTFLPAAVLLTVWCYQHPERLDGNPDAVFDDMRKFWPMVAVFEVVLVSLFVRGRRQPGVRAKALMEKAHRLLAEGKLKEADAAYAEGQRLLDHQ
jgi:hypothetical protein